MSRSDGSAAFEAHFAAVYGERWPALRAALSEPALMVRRPNAFAPPAVGAEGSPRRHDNGLLDSYIMDPASAAAARALAVQPGHRVLDLCAAPGGKTLILAEALFAPRLEASPRSTSEGRQGAVGELVANEMSASRRERLIQVIRQYVPRDVRDHVFVRGRDGAQFGLREPESFDRILVDAPCSGERHLLAHPAELARWSRRGVERLVARQYALLAGAWLALRPGGRLVYSTCSIEPAENDGVIERLLNKKSAARSVSLADDFPLGESTAHGLIFLPDRGGGGPIYFAALEKGDG